MYYNNYSGFITLSPGIPLTTVASSLFYDAWIHHSQRVRVATNSSPLVKIFENSDIHKIYEVIYWFNS